MTEFYEGARPASPGGSVPPRRRRIIFTSGATASLNTVAYAWGDKFVGPGDNIVVSELEHHSTSFRGSCSPSARGRNPGPAVRRRGCVKNRPPCRRLSTAEPAPSPLRRHPTHWAPARPAARGRRGACCGAIVVVDGCQGAVHGGVERPGVGLAIFYAFSGHKLYGPTGIGVLYGKRALLESMPPFMGARHGRTG